MIRGGGDDCLSPVSTSAVVGLEGGGSGTDPIVSLRSNRMSVCAVSTTTTTGPPLVAFPIATPRQPGRSFDSSPLLLPGQQPRRRHRVVIGVLDSASGGSRVLSNAPSAAIDGVDGFFVVGMVWSRGSGCDITPRTQKEGGTGGGAGEAKTRVQVSFLCVVWKRIPTVGGNRDTPAARLRAEKDGAASGGGGGGGAAAGTTLRPHADLLHRVGVYRVRVRHTGRSIVSLSTQLVCDVATLPTLAPLLQHPRARPPIAQWLRTPPGAEEGSGTAKEVETSGFTSDLGLVVDSSATIVVLRVTTSNYSGELDVSTCSCKVARRYAMPKAAARSPVAWATFVGAGGVGGDGRGARNATPTATTVPVVGISDSAVMLLSPDLVTKDCDARTNSNACLLYTSPSPRDRG